MQTILNAGEGRVQFFKLEGLFLQFEQKDGKIKDHQYIYLSLEQEKCLTLQEFAYYGSSEEKQDKPERIDEPAKDEETNGSAGEEAVDVEAKNQIK